MQDKDTEEEEEGSEAEEVVEQDRQEEKSGDDQDDGGEDNRGEVQADFAGQGNSQEDVVQVADAEDLDEWKVTFDKFISISCWISLLGSYGVTY